MPFVLTLYDGGVVPEEELVQVLGDEASQAGVGQRCITNTHFTQRK